MKSVRLETRVPAPVAEESTGSIARSARLLPSGRWLLCHKLLRDPSAVLGGAMIVVLICTALCAPYIAPFPEDVAATHPAQRLRAPSWEHPLGTDTLGRDIYSRVVFGGRITLIVAFTVVGACLLIGVPAELIAGYYDNLRCPLAQEEPCTRFEPPLREVTAGHSVACHFAQGEPSDVS